MTPRRGSRPFVSASAGATSFLGGRSGQLGQDADTFYVRLDERFGANQYGGVEVWIDSDRDTVEAVGRRVLTAEQPGVFLSLDGDPEPTLPCLALCRLGPGSGGRLWELALLDGGAGESAAPLTNCRSKFAGWRPSACLTIQVLEGVAGCDNVAAQTFAAAGNGTTYVWVGDEVIPVALGDGVLTIYRDADGDPAAKIEVDTGSAGVVTVVGTYVACAGDYLEWAFAGLTLCTDENFVACGDNTFRVRAKCAADCTPMPVTTCEAPVPPRELCMAIQWVPGAPPDAGQDADCLPCEAAMTIRFGTHLVEWAGNSEYHQGWYGEMTAPAGCNFPDGMADAGGNLKFFMGFPDSTGGLYTGVIFVREYLPAPFVNSVFWGIACDEVTDPFAHRIVSPGASAPVVLSRCGHGTIFDNGFTVTIWDSGGVCAIPTELSDGMDGAGEPLDGHPSIEAVIVGGANAGTYTFVWDAGDARYEDGSDTLTESGGVWTMVVNGSSGAATAVQPLFLEDPRDFGLTFDAADFGATSDPTAALA